MLAGIDEFVPFVGQRTRVDQASPSRALLGSVLVAASVLVCLCPARPALSQEDHLSPPPGTTRGRGEPLEWTGRRFGSGDIVVTSLGAAFAITSIAIGPTETTTNEPQLGIDESVRDRLRPSSYQVRRAWRDTSDVLLALNVSYPLFGDALVNAAWYRSSPHVATQMALIDTEAFIVTLAIQQGFANFVGRQRPHGAVCCTEELPEATASCEVRDRYRSYFSGHTSLSFAGAALTCTHHRHLDLHGGRGEWIPCITGVLLASGTGAMRVLGDRHYFTDVMTGAAVGSLVGWMVPFLHYKLPPRRTRAERSRGARILVLPTRGGFQLRGEF